MARILEIDVPNLRAVVQPGVINLHLSTAVAPHGLYFVPDPSSQKACTLGGAALLATLGRKSRLAAAAGGGLVLAGEAALRWSVFKAGFQSARDPKYTVKPQRDRHR